MFVKYLLVGTDYNIFLAHGWRLFPKLLVAPMCGDKRKKTHRVLTYSIHRKQRFFRLFNQLFTIAFEFEIHKSQARYVLLVSIVLKSNSEKDQLNVCGADKLYQKLLN